MVECECNVITICTSHALCSLQFCFENTQMSEYKRSTAEKQLSNSCNKGINSAERNIFGRDNVRFHLGFAGSYFFIK